jgi:hypothetical protein
MKASMGLGRGGLAAWAGLFLALLLAGCATTKVDWTSRIGHYTYDQAVVELGPPDKSAKLADGSVVSDWLLFRGGTTGSFQGFPGAGMQYYEATPTPDYYLRLVFDAQSQLKEWKRYRR